MVTLAALVFVALATTAGGDTLAKCSPKPEKLYTPNKPQIEAQLLKLESLEEDMRAVIADMRMLQTADTFNRRLGKFEGYRQITGQVTKAICAGVNMADPKKLGVICNAGESISDAVNDVLACAKGEVLGCVGLGLGRVGNKLGKDRKKIDQRVENLGGNKSGADLRELWDEELQNAKGQAKLNELKQKAVELGKKGKDVSGKVVEKDTIGLMSDACAVLKGGGGIGSKVAKGGETACVLGNSIAKSVEIHQDIQELDAASKQNQERQTKLIQQLEARVSTVAQKIAQLRADVVTIDWSAMGKPEPNMTPIMQEECDDPEPPVTPKGLLIKPEITEATKEEVQHALSQMKKPGLIGSLRSPTAEANSSLFSGENVPALLGGAVQALLTIQGAKDSKQAPAPPGITLSPKKETCFSGFNCLEDLQKARRRAAAEQEGSQLHITDVSKPKKQPFPTIPEIGGCTGGCGCSTSPNPQSTC
ncbi:MAG: hypothetical protein ABI988_09330 [Nitrospirota bacterium]